MSAILTSMRSVHASSSRLMIPRRATLVVRAFSSTVPRSDIQAEIDKRINPREVIEKKRKEFEDKYGDKLKKRVEKEGLQDLDALKKKVMTPSVKEALKTKRRAEEYKVEEQERVSKQYSEEMDVRSKVAEHKKAKAKAQASKQAQQGEGDRAGVKPLGSIINLPLIHLTPHDNAAIAKIWTTYHATHPTLSNSFLSASLPASTYNSMINLVRANPFFVIPLPRSAASSESSQVKTDEYEMFYLQWLLHPTPTGDGPPSNEPLPPTASAIFTPLEEFKNAGEWAQPYLVLTHYPDLANSHETVLMRGEISSSSAGGPDGSDLNPGFLLSQPQAQLLALALQRFYCAGIEVNGEGQAGRQDREKRQEALIGFRERPQEWDWSGLVGMAYGGLV